MVWKWRCCLVRSDDLTGLNIRPCRVREPFVLVKDAGHSVYRNIKGFGGMVDVGESDSWDSG